VERAREEAVRKQSAPAEPAPAVAPREDVKVATSPLRCPFCHDDIPLDRDDWVVCKACLARHHTACWREGKKCSACGQGACLRAAGSTRDGPRRTQYSVLDDRRRVPGEDAGQSTLGILTALTSGVVYSGVELSLWLLAFLVPIWLVLLVHHYRKRRNDERLLRESLSKGKN
jgi:hypothetical protein